MIYPEIMKGSHVPHTEYLDHDQFEMHNMSRASHRSSHYQRRMRRLSRKGSHVKGMGIGLDHSISHRSLLHKEINEASHSHCEHMFDEELINPDEFEEIAEIYDSIRQLH
jgi:hypothetical protein